MPRRTKLTKQLIAEFAEVLEAGNYFSVACAATGIHEATGYEWLADGRKELEGPRSKQTLKAEFTEAVEKASAAAERLAVGLVIRAGFDDWRAAMTFLERRFSDRWRRRNETTLVASGGNGVGPDPVELYNRQIAELRSRKSSNSVPKVLSSRASSKPKEKP